MDAMETQTDLLRGKFAELRTEFAQIANEAADCAQEVATSPACCFVAELDAQDVAGQEDAGDAGAEKGDAGDQHAT